MTFAEAQEWLRERGVETKRMAWGLTGRWVDGAAGYEIKLSGGSDGGVEMSVRPEPGVPTWWIHAQTMDELLNMLFEAQSDVAAGRADTWLEALKVKDPLRWMDPDHKAPKPGP